MVRQRWQKRSLDSRENRATRLYCLMAIKLGALQDDLTIRSGSKGNADRICRLSQFLEQQGINVVCAILSIFPESRNWCRENLINYYEVFIDSPINDLIQRDSKGLYRQFNEGKIRNVAGLDLEFTIPEMPDLLIKNDSTLDDLLLNASPIFQQLNNQVI